MPNTLPNGQFIKLLHVRMEKQVNNSLRSDDLTMMQTAVLKELQAAEQQLTMKEQERRFGVARSTVAGVLSRLEQKGFVEALSDPGDKRIKIERITSAGRNCCESAACCMDDAETRMVRGFSEAEQKIFNELLTRAAENMK